MLEQLDAIQKEALAEIPSIGSEADLEQARATEKASMEKLQRADQGLEEWQRAWHEISMESKDVLLE